MKNIKNNSIFFSLISFIIFTAFFTPSNVDAFYYVGWVNGNYIGCETQLDSNANFVGCGHVNTNNTNNNNNGNNNNNNGNISNPVPVMYSISPNSGKLDSGTRSVTVSGINFTSESIVRFNYSDRPTDFINSKTLKFQLLPSDLSKKGNFPITVATPGPGGGVSNIVKFNVNNNQTNQVSGGISNTNSNSTTSSNTFDMNYSNENTSGSNLSANALSASSIFSTNGFIPNTFLEWLVIFFLVLFIVILWRKLYVTEEKKHAPLKHA